MITVSDVSLNFGGQNLFTHVDLKFTAGNCYGVIGANGAGKSTFLRILSGDLDPSSGTVAIDPKTRMSVLKQDHFAFDEYSVLDTIILGNPRLYEIIQQKEALYAKEDFSDEDGVLASELEGEFAELNGWEIETDAARLLQGLGLDSALLEAPMNTLSDKEKVKILLAQALFGQPDIILLDEPTNHLDIASVEWLEEFLRAYSGAAVIISHDRYFLDRVTNRTIELSHGKLYTTNGNYSQHKETRAHDQEVAEKHYKTAMRDIQHVESSIAQLKQFNREKSIRAAESKEKMLERMKAQLEIPEAMQETIHFDFRAAMTSGNEVLNAEGLAMGFGSRQLFRNAAFSLRRGERVFLLGPNGCGKTTMLKIINGQLSPQRGTVRLGAKVSIGYYDQTQAGLDNRKTVIETVWDRYPALTQTELRNALAAFLFRGEDVFRPVSLLSGGERARLLLLQLMLARDNLLLLDEPTNHLDIASCEALEDALSGYDGTIFIVSHDRYFINRMADKVIRLTEDGCQIFPGNYDNYLEKFRELSAPTETQQAPPKENPYKLRKEQEAGKRRLLGRIRRCEEAVSAAEAEVEQLRRQLEQDDVMADYSRVLELTAQLDEKNRLVEQLMSEWEAMQLEAEEWEIV